MSRIEGTIKAKMSDLIRIIAFTITILFLKFGDEMNHVATMPDHSIDIKNHLIGITFMSLQYQPTHETRQL
jgi:hypothetical protein